MGVWPLGAQVLTTRGIKRKPDSSAKTRWAPSRVAFFLSAASLSVASAQWHSHPSPGRGVLVSAGSSSDCASSVRRDRGGTGFRTDSGSIPQCEPWSRDWSCSRASSAPAGEGRPSAVGASAPTSAGVLERNALAPPLRRASRQRITELGLQPMRRPTSLRDSPESSNASARLRRSSSRSALPFSLGIGVLLLNTYYCILYADINSALSNE